MFQAVLYSNMEMHNCRYRDVKSWEKITPPAAKAIAQSSMKFFTPQGAPGELAQATPETETQAKSALETQATPQPETQAVRAEIALHLGPHRDLKEQYEKLKYDSETLQHKNGSAEEISRNGLRKDEH